MDPLLSADGFDEAVRIMYGGDLPAWGKLDTDGMTLRVQATDTGDSWLITLGRFTGTDPDEQRAYDQAGIEVADADSGARAWARITGMAADLDCWLWGRPTQAAIERSGDPAVIDEFDAIIAEGIG